MNGHDLFTVNSWAHCHTLEALHRLTNRRPARISTCAASTTAIGSQPESKDQEAVDPRAGRRPTLAARRPRSSTDLPAAYKYPFPHYTL